MIQGGFLVISRGISDIYQVKKVDLDNSKTFYMGQVDDDDEPNGIGRLVHSDGSIWEGQLKTVAEPDREVVPEGFIRKIDS